MSDSLQNIVPNPYRTGKFHASLNQALGAAPAPFLLGTWHPVLWTED